MENQVNQNENKNTRVVQLVVLSGIAMVIIIGISWFTISKLVGSIPTVPLNTLSGAGQTDSMINSSTNSIVKSVQFYQPEGSADYQKLFVIMGNLNSTIALNTSSELNKEIEVFYKEALKFAFNSSNSVQERAYVLNMINLIYIQGFQHDPLFNAIQDSTEVLGEYNKNLGEVRKYKKVRNAVASIMYDNGQSDKNYAMHKTMQYLDDTSYRLYPNIYAILRSSLNFNQANLLLFYNYDLGKKYKDVNEFIRDKYFDGYVEYYEPKISKLKQEGNFYKDLGLSSYEANIMYAEFLIIKYRRTPDVNVEARKEILRQVLEVTDEMIKITDKYNAENKLFHGYFFSAIGKARVANFKLLSQSENDALISNAVTILENMINSIKNPEMDYWIKSLSKGSTMYQVLNQLAAKSTTISNYLSQVRK